MTEGIKGIIRSRKALLVLVAIIGITVLVALGKMLPADMLDFLKVILPVWLTAQGFEDGMEKYNPLNPAPVVNVAGVPVSGEPEPIKPQPGA